MTFPAANEPARTGTTPVKKQSVRDEPAALLQQGTRPKPKANPPAAKTKTAAAGSAAARPRPGSKTAKVITLLKRPQGASLKQLLKATGWQPHSVRGFLSGTVGRKMGLKVTSTKAESGDRRYALKA